MASLSAISTAKDRMKNPETEDFEEAERGNG